MGNEFSFQQMKIKTRIDRNKNKCEHGSIESEIPPQFFFEMLVLRTQNFFNFFEGKKKSMAPWYRVVPRNCRERNVSEELDQENGLEYPDRNRTHFSLDSAPHSRFGKIKYGVR